MATRSSLRLGRRVVAATALIVGLALLATGLAQPIKAATGHHLLEQTFHARLAAPRDEQATAERWRPWPWADVSPVAKLHFPNLGEDRVVLNSASGEALAWGVGHVPGTAPLGGPGIAAVAGHRDGRFELLADVREGDEIELTTLTGITRRYVVDARVVVDSRRVELPIDHHGTAELLLTTCWPIDGLFAGPERLVVSAALIP